MLERQHHDGNSPGEIEVVSRPIHNGIVIEVSGEVDLATAQEVEREMLRAEESGDLIALDLSKTSFMDSTGLHMLIAADQRMRERGGRLVVIQGPDQVRRLLQLTRVDDRLELVQDADELKRATVARG